MKDLHSTVREITQITTYIETHYPELYRYLDEDPMTIPVTSHPQMDEKVLQEYLRSLKQLLERYQQTHKKN